MKQKIYSNFGFLISLVCFEFIISCFGFAAKQAHSQSASFSVSPPVVEVLLSPNKQITQTFTLHNEGEAIAYSLSFHQVIPTDELGHTTIDPVPLSFVNLPVSAKLQNQTLDTTYPLEAGATASVTVELSSATLDAPLDQYFALVFTLSNPHDLNESTQVSSQIAALILTTTTPFPAIPTDISLEDFAPRLIQDTFTPLSLSPKIVNNAPIMLRVKGELTLSTPAGSSIKTLPIDPTLVLGGTSRQLSNFEFLVSSFKIGPHTLKLTLYTEGGRTLLESEKVVYFLPLRLLVILFSLLLIKLAWSIRAKRLQSIIKSNTVN